MGFWDKIKARIRLAVGIKISTVQVRKGDLVFIRIPEKMHRDNEEAVISWFERQLQPWRDKHFPDKDETAFLIVPGTDSGIDAFVLENPGARHRKIQVIKKDRDKVVDNEKGVVD